MIRSVLCTSLVLVLLPQPTEANDIVDFFKAISGPSPRAQVAYGREVDHRGHQVVSHLPVDRRGRLTQTTGVGASHRHGAAVVSSRAIANPRVSRGRAITTGSRGSGLSLHVSIGNTAPAVPGYVPTQSIGRLPAPRLPAPPLPAPPLPNAPLPSGPLPGQFDHLPHQFGQVVTCQVPVFTHVHIESACDIAPNAVPTLVAVRDPNLGRFRSCVEQVVYIEVLAPPCVPRRVRVSPCRTRVRMDYGRYEVTIRSRNGSVTVEYND